MMRTKVMTIAATISAVFASNTTMATENVWDSFLALSSEYPERFAGSEGELRAANWLKAKYKALGYSVKVQNFDFDFKGQSLKSNNLEVVVKGQTDKTIIIGAHYDAIGHQHGSKGFTDNASGTTTLLGLAKNLKDKKPYYTIKIVSFGAEEIGKVGSNFYVNALGDVKESIVGMINLDTVVGGDSLYIHSAHSNAYPCKSIKDVNYSKDTWVRDALLKESGKLPTSYALHPETKGYPEGETGGWSDHAPFACAGIPIAHIEATNFLIDGESGTDGYSQTKHEKYWTCFEESKMGACNRKKEQHWGKIWHTQFDTQEAVFPELESRIKSQFHSNITLLTNFVLKQK
jgi:hypothetical protein